MTRLPTGYAAAPGRSKLSRRVLMSGVAGSALGMPAGPVRAAGPGDASPDDASPGYTSGVIAARDAAALAASRQAAARRDTASAQPDWNYAHFLIYGQSLASAYMGWPALSVTAEYPDEVFMVGQSVRPEYETSQGGPRSWSPMGGLATFRPLIATNDVEGGLLTTAAVRALPANSFARGESALVAACNGFRALQLRRWGVRSNPARALVAGSCGVGGQSVATLSYVPGKATPFTRLVECAGITKGLVPAGETYGIAGLVWMEGEKDYQIGTSRAEYQADLLQLRADFNAQVVRGVAGQSAIPAWFTYQTNMGYTRDNLAIGQAQLNLALSQPGWYLVTPDYPVTDKGSHPDANGYRWMGCQFAKVMHLVLNLRQAWLPLHPTRISYRGQQILASFHVPAPPLQLQNPWTGNYAARPPTLVRHPDPDQGFTAYDDAGVLHIASVVLTGAATVRITVARPFSTNPMLRYADHTYGRGNGCLCDSDATAADEVYAYTAGSGQFACDDIGTTGFGAVGAPYPLWNWCAAFDLPIVAD